MYRAVDRKVYIKSYQLQGLKSDSTPIRYFCCGFRYDVATMVAMAQKRFSKEQVNVRIAPQLLDRLDKIGEPIGVTRTELIRRAVEEYVMRHEQNHQQQPTKQQPRH